MRKFELPYNFDKNLINILSILDPIGQTIDCIYVPPFLEDYQTILRTGEQAHFLASMTRTNYEDHINFINSIFPNKIQLLLQKNNIILSCDKLKYYRNLGIKNYCVGSVEQGKIIKEFDSSLKVVGSITLQINANKIQENYSEYINIFDSFVLPFKFSRNLNNFQNLPKGFNYILLINAYCNINCTGKKHWDFDYKDSNGIVCPGILNNNSNSILWNKSARIRPMDLGFFDPYISIYKLQDRGWPTSDIIRDYILYTSDFSIYPNIIYSKDLYYEK